MGRVRVGVRFRVSVRARAMVRVRVRVRVRADPLLRSSLGVQVHGGRGGGGMRMYMHAGAWGEG